ncbi:MAG: universal stress protein [Chitinophagaceae bacterium]
MNKRRSTAEGITEYAQNQGMKLIILSSHGRHGLTQWGISSVTQKIIYLSAQTSLLIVRAHQYGANAGEIKDTSVYQHILVPLDGSQRAENVLPVITQLANFHKSKIYLCGLSSLRKWHVKCRLCVKMSNCPIWL